MSAPRPAKSRAWAVRTSVASPRRPVVPRRTPESSPTSRTGSAPKSCRRRAAACAPARREDPGRRSHRRLRVPQRRKHFEGQTRLRTPNTAPAAPSRHRRAGRTTTPPHNAALMPLQGPPRADQQPEPLIETIAGPPLAVIDAIRDAANSMANGIPSRRRQISTTAATSSALSIEKRGAKLPARSTKRIHRGRVDSPARSRRGHRPHLLVGDPQPFAAGRRSLHGRRLRQDGLDRDRRRRRARVRSCRTPATGSCPPAQRPRCRSRCCPAAG